MMEAFVPWAAMNVGAASLNNTLGIGVVLFGGLALIGAGVRALQRHEERRQQEELAARYRKSAQVDSATIVDAAPARAEPRSDASVAGALAASLRVLAGVEATLASLVKDWESEVGTDGTVVIWREKGGMRVVVCDPGGAISRGYPVRQALGLDAGPVVGPTGSSSRPGEALLVVPTMSTTVDGVLRALQDSLGARGVGYAIPDGGDGIDRWSDPYGCVREWVRGRSWVDVGSPGEADGD